MIIQSRAFNLASRKNEGAKSITKPGEITMEDDGIIANDDDGSVSKFIIATTIDTTLVTSRKDEGISKTMICCKMNEYKAIYIFLYVL